VVRTSIRFDDRHIRSKLQTSDQLSNGFPLRRDSDANQWQNGTLIAAAKLHALISIISSGHGFAMQYFEDIKVGYSAAYGRYEVTREEVIEFATKFDMQPFHLDDEAAAKTHFGRIAASGWHICAMTMNMMVKQMEHEQRAGLGSPGVDEVRWRKPVYPDDTLRVETEVIDKKRSRSRPEMGSYRTRIKVFNQEEIEVMSLVSIGLIRTRPDSQDAAV